MNLQDVFKMRVFPRFCLLKNLFESHKPLTYYHPLRYFNQEFLIIQFKVHRRNFMDYLRNPSGDWLNYHLLLIIQVSLNSCSYFCSLFFDYRCIAVAIERLTVFLYEFKEIFLKINEFSWRIEHYPQNVFHFRRRV